LIELIGINKFAEGKIGRRNWGQASQLHIFFFYFCFTFCEFVKSDPGSFTNGQWYPCQINNGDKLMVEVIE